MSPPIDPVAPFGALLLDIGGLSHGERIRRGMVVHATTPRPPVGTTPNTVVHRQNKLRLRHYAATSTARSPTPVVLVPSLINRATICDLEPDRSLVRGLAQLGHDVYLVDWGIPGEEDATDDVAHVVLDLLHRAVDRACRHAGSPDCFLLGYCQGGTLSAVYTALRPRRVRGLAVFNAPVDFSQGGRFATFTDPEAVDLDALIDENRLLSGEIMGAAFRMLDPVGSVTKFEAIDQCAEEPKRLARTLARERWLEENVPMPGTFAKEFIRATYQDNRLMDGSWTIGGERVDLSTIRCPLLVCAAARDFISPAASVLPLASLTSSPDVTAETLQTGHIGVIVGSFGPRVFYPLLDRWFRARLAPASNPSAPHRENR
jgi:polyhydroxyalkanoate synthase